jgi:hypothetical protein
MAACVASVSRQPVVELLQLLVTAFEEVPQRRIRETARLGPWNGRRIEHEALFDQIVGIGKWAVVRIGLLHPADVCLLNVQRQEPVTVS